MDKKERLHTLRDEQTALSEQLAAVQTEITQLEQELSYTGRWSRDLEYNYND